MSRFQKWLVLTFIFSCVSFFILCSQGDVAGTTDETSMGVATIYLADGKTPAPYAEIRFYTVGDTSKEIKLKLQTDIDGQFSVSEATIALNGTYNMWSQLTDSLIAIQDSVFISSTKNYIRSDTLGKPGSITGIAGLQPNHDPRTVTVQALGTHIWSNVDSTGCFLLTGMAEGKYTLKISTTLPNYTPIYPQLSVKSDSLKILPDTLWLIYTGIPIVKGMTVVYDTINGSATLKWNKTNFNNIQDYLIYRAFYSDINWPDTPFCSVLDTFYTDCIFNKTGTGIFSFSDTNDYRFKYQVIIRDNSNLKGLPYKYVSVTAASPTKTKTTFTDSVFYKNQLSNSALLYDTLHCFSRIYNPNRFIIDIKWLHPETDSMIKVKTIADTLHLINDTLLYSSDKVGLQKIKIIASDNGGKQWYDTIPVSFCMPSVKSPVLTYDTLKGIVSVDWTPPAHAEAYNYKIVRNISCNAIQLLDTLPVTAALGIQDTIFPKVFSFDTLSPVFVNYIIHTNQISSSTVDSGVSISKSVHSYKFFKPHVFAGKDKFVGIGSTVTLTGTVFSSTFSIIKREWKIKDADWVESSDGTLSFTTNSTLYNDTIPCIFKVTDSLTNIGYDTTVVIKCPLAVTFQKPIGKQGSPTIVMNHKYWADVVDFGGTRSVYSSDSMTNWKLEKQYLPLNNNYSSLYKFNDKMWFMNSRKDSVFYSTDGTNWSSEKISVRPHLMAWSFSSSNILDFNGKLYIFHKKEDSLFLHNSEDGINFNYNALIISYRVPILFKYKNKLCKLSEYSSEVCQCSEDEGATWQDEKLWDTDQFPDHIYQIISDDSITLAYFQENPSTQKKVYVYKNDNWIENQTLTSIVIENHSFGLCNRRIILDRFSNNYFEVIKLY